MRRHPAHFAPNGTGEVGLNAKALSGLFSSIYQIGPWCLFCPCSSVEKGVRSDLPAKVDSGPRPEEQPPTKRMVGGSSPSRGTTSNQPRSQCHLLAGLNLGLSPKAGIDYPQSFWTVCPEKARVQIDVPQPQNRDGKGWTRAEQRPAV